MARFFSFALLFLALVSAALANVRPKPVKKEYQLAINCVCCDVRNMNFICSPGKLAPGQALASSLIQSTVNGGGNNSVSIKLQEIRKAETGASRD